MAYTCKGRYRDLRRCLRSLDSFTDGQARILDWEQDALDYVRLEITPNGGAYKDGTFHFEVRFPTCYPDEAPTVNCLTNIYHPNIDPTADSENVCLNLFSEWDRQFGIEDVVQGLLFLFYCPNQEDPLSPFFSSTEDEEFDDNVKKTLQGEEVGSFNPGDKCEIEIEEPLPSEVKPAEELLGEVDKRVDQLVKEGVTEDVMENEKEDTLEEEQQCPVEAGDNDSADSTEDSNITTADPAATPVDSESADLGIAAPSDGLPSTTGADGSAPQLQERNHHSDCAQDNNSIGTQDGLFLDRPNVSRQNSKTGYGIRNDHPECTCTDSNNNSEKTQYYKPFVERQGTILTYPEVDYMLTSLGAMCLTICSCVR